MGKTDIFIGYIPEKKNGANNESNCVANGDKKERNKEKQLDE